jgi:hypothetical protein
MFSVHFFDRVSDERRIVLLGVGIDGVENRNQSIHIPVVMSLAREMSRQRVKSLNIEKPLCTGDRDGVVIGYCVAVW